MKTADEIIDQFTSQCDPEQAATVFTRLFVGYNLLHQTGKPLHPLDPCNQNMQDEQIQKAIRAISTLLYEIEKSMQPMKS